MRGAHTKGWRECEIGEPEIGGYLLDQALYGLNVAYLLSQVNVQDGPACVFFLQFILQCQCFENIISVIYRELG